jgi:hypothetical protein
MWEFCFDTQVHQSDRRIFTHPAQSWGTRGRVDDNRFCDADKFLKIENNKIIDKIIIILYFDVCTILRCVPTKYIFYDHKSSF